MRSSFIFSSIIVALFLIAAALFFRSSSEPITPSESIPTPNGFPAIVENESSDWKSYRNERLGFSMKIPKKVEIGDIYRTEESSVRVFEDGKSNVVYVRPSYYLPLYSVPDRKTGENTFEDLQREEQTNRLMWKITIERVATEAELEAFIKQQYGPGCVMGERRQSAQTGVFDVDIKVPDDWAGCGVNWKFVIKYFPERQKVAAWDIGQDVNFVDESEDGQRSIKMFDHEMAESFRFE